MQTTHLAILDAKVHDAPNAMRPDCLKGFALHVERAALADRKPGRGPRLNTVTRSDSPSDTSSRSTPGESRR
jgi:hypothetical protein